MAPTLSSLFFFFYVFVTVTILPFVAANSEGDALIALKQSLTDPNNVLQSWDPSSPDPCGWYRVECDVRNSVIRLDLGNSNLGGHLVPDLGKLQSLKYLMLYKNNIQGVIPPELGNLKSVIAFDLYENKLSGHIPPSLGNLKNAKFIRLNNNQLTGQVPWSLKHLPHLIVLDVSHNHLINPHF